MDAERKMEARIECFACGDPDPPRAPQRSLGRLLKIAAAVAVAAVLMYGEIWVIQQDPASADVYAAQPAVDANSDTDGPIRDTAGPVAVLH
jgi:hypothetical protein